MGTTQIPFFGLWGRVNSLNTDKNRSINICVGTDSAVVRRSLQKICGCPNIHDTLKDTIHIIIIFIPELQGAYFSIPRKKLHFKSPEDAHIQPK